VREWGGEDGRHEPGEKWGGECMKVEKRGWESGSSCNMVGSGRNRAEIE